MSSHVYHEIYLHLNWHTKLDAPVRNGPLEALTHSLIREKCRAMKGVYFHEIGGTDTHVHLVVNIEPFVTISDMAGELKGSSSFEVNKRSRQTVLEWQRGYGVVSFGKQNLDWVLDYVRRQREHHASGKVHERLESCDVAEAEEHIG